MSAISGEELLGAWQLEQYEVSFSDRRPPTFPFGHGPTGLLLYSHDGAMSVTIAARGRGQLSIDPLQRLDSAPEQEKARAFQTFLSYAGIWLFGGDEVTHVIEIASLPNLVGEEQVHAIDLRAGRLMMSYLLEASSGVVHRHEMIWKRR